MPQILDEDEPDLELLALLKKSLSLGTKDLDATYGTGVLESAEYIYDNSTDVAMDMRGTKSAAASIWAQMQQRSYSTVTWSQHELHPTAKNEDTVNFIFVMDLLNFCFWSEKGPDERFAIYYRGRKWTGYNSLVAALRRAVDEGLISIGLNGRGC